MLHLLISLFNNLLEFDINPIAQYFVCNYTILTSSILHFVWSFLSRDCGLVLIQQDNSLFN